MRKKLLPVIILTVLTLSVLTIMPIGASHHEKPIIVAHSKGALEADVQLKAMIGNITYIDWKVVFGEITAADLDGATMLMMSKSDSSMEYTDAELSAIDTWIGTGGKTLWVSADSDYGTDHMRQPTANKVLAKVGSQLRIDDASLEDPVSNAGAPYRVVGVSDNADSEIDFLVRGVSKGVFHGPGVVVGYDGSGLVDVSELDNCYIVMTTSETGIVVDNSEPSPVVVEVGAEGSFPLMVVEIDYTKANTIIATGEAPFDQYVGLYKPEIRRYDRYGPTAAWTEGDVLIENIIKFATVLGPDYINAQADIMSLESDKTSLASEVSDLESEVSDLGAEISTLESDKASLESNVASLEGQVSSLEADVDAAKSSASTMQMAAIAALIIGIIIGYFVGPMLKK
jgi:hypothetical protein